MTRAKTRLYTLPAMRLEQAYNTWATSYDTVANKTRDLEAQALRAVVPAGRFERVVELGCGTGKNTAWLAAKAAHLTAVDFSTEMLRQAQQKLAGHQPPITFALADITRPWHFAPASATDLLTSSLILEHLPDLEVVFAHARRALRPSGLFYLGELHPFKQYLGSQARFDTPTGTVELECYVHHLSDYTEAARRHGFQLQRLQEWFDQDAPSATPPRIVSFLFEV